MNRLARLGVAFTAVTGLTLLALAAPIPASPSLSVAGTTTSELTGLEIIAGKVSGVTGTPEVLNVTARGIFSDRGAVRIQLSDQGGRLTFRLSRGSILVAYQPLRELTVIVLANCHITEHLRAAYRLVIGTGAYAGATGRGWLTTSFGSRYPVVKGACMGVLAPIHGSSTATVSLRGPLTERTGTVTLPAGSTISP